MPSDLKILLLQTAVPEDDSVGRTLAAAGCRVVLTGGTSQLPGVHELATTILDKQVRLGQPRPIEGLADAVGGPAFATCAGLLNHAVNNKTDDLAGAYCAAEKVSSRLGRFGHWFREHF